MELDFCSFQINIAWNFKSQGTEKFELFSQGTYDSQNLRNETLVIADYDNEIVFRFAMFDMMLWPKEENICINFPLSGE